MLSQSLFLGSNLTCNDLPHSSFASSLVKVAIRLVNKHVQSSEVRVKLSLELGLPEDGV